VIIINSLVGFYQEVKANESLVALRKMVKFRNRVLRNGRELEVNSEELVPGDIVIFKTGDKVTADCRIIWQEDLSVNEAVLTGESRPVFKDISKIERVTMIPDRKNMLFSGTSIESGESQAVVVAIGQNTEFGKMIQRLKETKDEPTPLQKKITKLSQQLSLLIFLLVGIIFVLGILRGNDFINIFISSLALAVSSIPEGLPVAITVVLVLAMRKILKNKGLVKKLISAEALGSVTVVCTDKTGTLTEGNMKVSRILTGTKELLSDGKKFNHTINRNGIDSHVKALLIATLTNDAYIENPDDPLSEWIVRGYFTDRALLLAGVQAGINKKEEEKMFPLIKKMSFDSRIKMAATLRDDKVAGKTVLFVVGAPEKLIEKSKLVDCDGEAVKIEDEKAKLLLKRLNELTKKGLRVIACALRELDQEEKEAVKKGSKKMEDLLEQLTLFGFIALQDPIRKEVKKAVRDVIEAGIRPIMITGDHPLTAKTIAQELGIPAKNSQIMKGTDLENISDSQLAEKINDIFIFARAVPEHKLRIVKALKKKNEVVAMFGDGVNDVIALKAADVGIAVESGTDVAKETADVILLNDSFSVVAKAIEQGRIAFKNIQKVFIYLIADDFTEIILFLFSTILNLPLPLLPAQILWINLIEDTLPAMALSTEEEREGIMKEKPRKFGGPIIDNSIKKWAGIVLFFNGLITVAFFFFLLESGIMIEKVRTMIFALMAFDSLAFVFSIKNFKRTIFSANPIENKYILGAFFGSIIFLVLAIYLPLLQKILKTVSLGYFEWMLILGITIIEIIIFEIFKKLFLIRKA